MGEFAFRWLETVQNRVMKRYLIPVCLSAFLFTSCQEKEAEPTEGRDEPPAEETTDASEGEAKDSDFVGMTIEDGEALAKERGLAYRTVEIDGEGLMATADFRPDRVNFSIAKGKIIKVTRG